METDGKKREYIEWFPRAFFGKAAVRFCPNTASLAGWHNSTYDSAWLSHSPVVNDFLRGYLGGQEDRIRLIVKDDGQGKSILRWRAWQRRWERCLCWWRRSACPQRKRRNIWCGPLGNCEEQA